MRSTSRRQFISRSVAGAAALTLGQLSTDAFGLAASPVTSAGAQPVTTAYPWGAPMVPLANTQVEYFIYVNFAGEPGRFALPNPYGVAASMPAGTTYQKAYNADLYTWQRPMALAPGVWDRSEMPTRMLAVMQSRVYLVADTYTRTNCGVALAQATDQQKVAAIMASLRDHLLSNFCQPVVPPLGQSVDHVLTTKLDQYMMGTGRMMQVFADAVARPGVVGYQVQCTATAKFLPFFLNGYGICAREWDAVTRFDLSPGYEVPVMNIDGQALAGVAAPLHGTVEYYDRQFGKWVFVDLLYGIAGVVNESVPSSATNLHNLPGVPLSLPELIWAMANGVDHAVLWTRRNQMDMAAADRWYTVLRGRDTYLSYADPNGNEAMLPTFMAMSGSAYNQYVTRRSARVRQPPRAT